MLEASVLDTKIDSLREMLRALGSVVIAYSGGVDSTFLARAAHDALGERSLAVTAVSPSLAASELEEAKELARGIGVRHVLIDSNEVSDPRYLQNGPDRCYFCKVEVYGLLANYAQQHGFSAVIDGTNVDDLRDPRPGRKAAKEHGVLSPLVDAGFTKADVREASRALGLPTADKPSMACLSSRIPFGTPVSIAALKQVERAEELLHSLGLGQVRVRHHRDTARIEVEADAFAAVLRAREQIVDGLKALGYTYVALDLEGYRMGSMNSGIKAQKQHEDAGGR